MGDVGCVGRDSTDAKAGKSHHFDWVIQRPNHHFNPSQGGGVEDMRSMVTAHR